MHKASLLIAGTLCVPLAAQVTPDPCFSPPVIGTPAPFPTLNGAALGTTEVAQLYVIPNPGGANPAYLGAATVTKTGAADYDVLTFTWNGPGSNPTVNNHADTLNGPGDEFQLSLSPNGLLAALDTGPGHPTGNGAPILATRANLTSQFGNARPIGGLPATYVDPQIAVINGALVLYWIDNTGGVVNLSDLDVATASISNTRIAVPSQLGKITGFQYPHSPTPVWEHAGGMFSEARALVHSIFSSSTGSDFYFSSAADQSQFPAAKALPAPIALGPRPVHDDGADWNANPLNVHGTSIWADAAGTYGDPLRIEYFGLNSVSFDTTTNSTINLVAHTPLSTQATLFGAINIGAALLPSPLDPNAFGIPGRGVMCVDPIAAISIGAVVNNELKLSFPVPPNVFPATIVIYAEALVLNPTAGSVWISNVAYIEGR